MSGMALSSIDKELLSYFSQLSEIQKESLLTMIKSFLSTSTDSERVSLEQYNKELEEAMEEIQRGDFIRHDQLVNLVKGI